MRDFCILQWTEEEQILFMDVASAYNVSDSLSKPTGRIKFYEHMDILMGRRKPAYVHFFSSSFFSTYRNFQWFILLEVLIPVGVRALNWKQIQSASLMHKPDWPRDIFA